MGAAEHVLGIGSHRTVKVTSAAIPQLLGESQLEFVRVSGCESLSELFTYTVDLRPVNVVAAQTMLEADLDDAIGLEMTLTIELGGMGTGLLGGVGAGSREITGIISAVEQVGGVSDNKLYRFTLRPWLWLATQTSDYKAFQNKTVIEILDEVLGDYIYSVEKRLDTSVYPKLEWEVQHGETDAHFIQRLTEEWGITYFFEHDSGHHRLVLVSESGAWRKFPSAAYHTLPIYPQGSKVDEEHLTRFEPIHRLRTGKIILKDYDPRAPKADLTTDDGLPRDTHYSEYERYEYAPGTYVDRSEGDLRARIRMEERRAKGKRLRGAGALRGVAAGCTYQIANHDTRALNREVLVIRTELQLEDVGVQSGSTQRYACYVSFEAQPTDEVFRPEHTAHKPRVRGIQRAVVTGPENQELWTNDHGCVKVQFEWDRYGQYDENSSPWIRVANAWSGDQYGGMHIPRIGQEVLVDYLNGDPNKPIVIGRAPNQLNLPPWSLPGQHALSGIASKELFGRRRNHLVMDDTQGQIQSQLSSDYLLSQLSIGHITRIPDSGGRKDKRGEGAELRTDGHMALRSAKGTLLSTEARQNVLGHALDMRETIARLKEALSIAETLHEASSSVLAQVDEQKGVADAIQAQNDAIKGSGEALGELTSPHVVVSSAAGIAATAEESTHLHSKQHTSLTTGEHLSFNVGKSLLASVKDMVSICAHKLGIKLFASRGPVDIQAQKDSMNLLAKLGISIVSTEDSIRIIAKKELLIGGGGSHTRYNAGGITHLTDGKYIAHAANHAWPAEQSLPIEMPLTPKPICIECLLKAMKAGSALAAV
ncbi:hypothetical protein LMG19083_03916 [Ralstonia psammae]|uniref:Type VI secretion system tip protein VgrG n=1 Tax=Ralstonia psammae TaxID=3058598 RepID=A0ABM9JTA5_9RALS|nr:type VI secretion system Vgr family protein [Ralstonia sp. LMG 19083]CAJ0803617.1 hypothetical protein LMG19083_03916 [Ralstonia sp. LMG 19083]